MICRIVHDFYPNMDMTGLTEVDLIWYKFRIPYPIRPWDMQ